MEEEEEHEEEEEDARNKGQMERPRRGIIWRAVGVRTKGTRATVTGMFEIPYLLLGTIYSASHLWRRMGAGGRGKERVRCTGDRSFMTLRGHAAIYLAYSTRFFASWSVKRFKWRSGNVLFQRVIRVSLRCQRGLTPAH